MPLNLENSLNDFLQRASQIQSIVGVIEVSARDPSLLSGLPNDINLGEISFSTLTTVNSMAIVFLASGYEEFIREAFTETAIYMSSRYQHLSDEKEILIRNHYWSACLDRLRLSKSIVTKNEPRGIDNNIFGKIRVIIESVQSLVISDDASQIDCSIFVQHSNNFRPLVVNELAKRIGISGFMDRIAENSVVQRYFGTSRKRETATRLFVKLDEFYDRRNEIVHSLTSVRGYGVDVVLDYINLFQIIGDAARSVLESHSRNW